MKLGEVISKIRKFAGLLTSAILTRIRRWLELRRLLCAEKAIAILFKRVKLLKKYGFTCREARYGNYYVSIGDKFGICLPPRSRMYIDMSLLLGLVSSSSFVWRSIYVRIPTIDTCPEDLNSKILRKHPILQPVFKTYRDAIRSRADSAIVADDIISPIREAITPPIRYACIFHKLDKEIEIGCVIRVR